MSEWLKFELKPIIEIIPSITNLKLTGISAKKVFKENS